MKQMVILSGKGGTGKTSLSAALAHLSSIDPHSPRPVFVDADVDAANLSLVLQPKSSHASEFWGSSIATIDPETCSNCGTCVSVCRYDAIFPDPAGKPCHWIDPIACDGCAACVYACPEGSINMVQQQEGNWYKSETAYGTLFHAELFPGKENSGKLVTLVKQQARLFAGKNNSGLVIIDGPPGIGCPVISACAGVDLGLIVTEPGLAGIHDMKRVLGTLKHFRIPPVICINKSDISLDGARYIRDYARSEDLEVLGEIPYDEGIPKALVKGEPITQDSPDSPAASAIQAVYEKVIQRLQLEKG